MQLPANLRQSLEEFSGSFKKSELESASIAISERYRRLDKKDAMLGINSPSEAMAYGATRLPATYSAACNVIDVVMDCLPDFAPLSMMDVGAGPATASFAALEYWPDIAKLTLVETNPHLLELGKRLLKSTHADVDSVWQQAEITSLNFANEPNDLVICGYVLNEIEQEKGQAALESTIKKLWNATGGILVIIEPGTPSGYRALMKIREQLIEEGAFIAAPCPHQSDCPIMDEAPKKWCHFSVRVERSKLHRQVKQDASLSYEDEKYSYIVASRHKPSAPEYRIIGHPRGTKPVAADVCANSGEAKHITINKSHPKYKSFRKAKWGDGV